MYLVEKCRGGGNPRLIDRSFLLHARAGKQSRGGRKEREREKESMYSTVKLGKRGKSQHRRCSELKNPSVASKLVGFFFFLKLAVRCNWETRLRLSEFDCNCAN